MSADTHACNCVGPQNGQPKCPCMMRGLIKRDGRWIEPERDLGPTKPTIDAFKPQGCICPPGAEITCQGALCPRRGYGACNVS